MKPLRAGDIIGFDGSDTSDCVHLVKNVLSNGIEVVTDSRLSHLAMVWPMDVPVNGKPQVELHIIESTILGGVDGVQLNPLAQRMADEAHGRVYAFYLAERWRDFLAWGDMWALAASKLGTDRYNVLEIAEYLARHIPFVQEIPALYAPNPHAEVCSELVALMLRRGGIPGLHPPVMPPQAVIELAIFECYAQLSGPPREILRFNSI